MSVTLISHPDCGRHDTGWSHPEHVGRIRAIPRALRTEVELFHALLHHEARAATEAELTLAHESGYITQVRQMAAVKGGVADADTPVSDGSWDAAVASAGAVLDAVDLSVGGSSLRSFCAVRPPGHHALRSRAMGFCFFGNVALGALYARQRHGLERVLIVDWDVHHGNGTQALVQHDAGIRFVSMHQWPWYPGTGSRDETGPHRTLFNLPMPGGLAASAYVDALRSGIDHAVDGWIPDLVLISAGFDSLRGDPLGGFTLEMEHVDELTRHVVDGARAWCGGRVVSSLEGGYDPERLGQAAVVHLRALLP